jgi:hypothetical protein
LAAGSRQQAIGSDIDSAPAVPGRAYLESPVRIATILGSFAVLCVPLAAAQLLISSLALRTLAVGIYAVLLGTTHFVVTLGVYLNSRNLRYFASSPRNVAIYFVAPLALFSAFFAIGFFGLHDPTDATPAFLAYLFWFTVLVRGADYFHVVRQSYGVLQLFKGQTRAALPPWTRTADNFFFLSMAGLQLLTFLHGLRGGSFTFTPSPPVFILLGLAALSLAGVLAGFATAARRATAPRALWVPFTYFLFQSVSASLPVWRSELYAVSLAMHYVEYHVVMFPRLFGFSLDPDSRVDRVSAWIRRHKVAFYVLLVVVAAFAARDLVWPSVSGVVGPTRALWLMFNLLNGVFVTHYFIEAFIWKFSNPYYGQSLAPLYFPRRAFAGTNLRDTETQT